MQISTVIKQKPYEKIIFNLHRHHLTFVPVVLLSLLLLLVPVVVYFLIKNAYPGVLKESLIYPAGVLLSSMYYLFVYMFFYIRFIDHYLDSWIVTNDRIVDIEQHGLFSKVTTELDLFRVQDVTTHISGAFGTIFRFGDVIITTASATNSIIFYNIPDPDRIRERLIALADEDRRYHYKDDYAAT